jgi:hypothetical protein
VARLLIAFFCQAGELDYLVYLSRARVEVGEVREQLGDGGVRVDAAAL